jgi:hypothetical protein
VFCIGSDTSDPMSISGLSTAAHTRPVADPAEIAKAMKLRVTISRICALP